MHATVRSVIEVAAEGAEDVCLLDTEASPEHLSRGTATHADTMLLIAASITASAAVAGIYASYYLDISTGASVVLAQSAFFALAYLFGPRQGVVSSALRRRSAAWA